MSIKFSADSTCDLSPELLQRYNISIRPLYVVMDGEPKQDGVSVTPDEMYAYTAASGKLCSTAAINVADYLEFFHPLSQENEAVIHTCISSEFSSCYQNACLAAQEFDNVYVVDSRNLSTGHGLVVLEGVDLAAAGKSVPEIVEGMQAVTARVSASFIPTELEYLRKGGRCSAVAALGANLLKLKPCIQVQEGKMGVGKKYRGNMPQVLPTYVKEMLAQPDTIDTRRVFITHSGMDEALIALVKETVESFMHFEEVLIARAGGTVSSHCGPGTLGVLFVNK